MPSAPNTDDNGTDQPDTDPGTQPGDAASSDEPSTDQGTGEAEGSANCDAVEADQAATDTGDSEDETEGKSEGEPFPPRGALTLRALRWGGLIGAVVLAATALTLCRGLVGAGVLVPSEVSALPRYIIVGGLLVWPSLNFRKKKRPILVTIMTTVMATLDVSISDPGMVGHLPGDRVLRPVPPGPGWSGALGRALPERRHTAALLA